jgi:hypothetical protein
VLTVPLTPTLDNAQKLGMLRQKQDQLLVLAVLHRTAIVVQGAQHHLHRDALSGCAQDLRDLLTEHEQYGRANQRRGELQLHGIGGTRPPIRQLHHPFGQRERLLDPPASPGQLAALTSRQPLGIKPMGQRALPHALPHYRAHAHRIRARVRPVVAHL